MDWHRHSRRLEWTNEWMPVIQPKMMHDSFQDQDEKRRLLFNWTALATTTLSLLVLRLWLSDFQTPQFAKADNPMAFLPSLASRTLTFLYLPASEIISTQFPLSKTSRNNFKTNELSIELSIECIRYSISDCYCGLVDWVSIGQWILSFRWQVIEMVAICYPSCSTRCWP